MHVCIREIILLVWQNQAHRSLIPHLSWLQCLPTLSHQQLRAVHSLPPPRCSSRSQREHPGRCPPVPALPRARQLYRPHAPRVPPRRWLGRHPRLLPAAPMSRRVLAALPATPPKMVSSLPPSLHPSLSPAARGERLRPWTRSPRPRGRAGRAAGAARLHVEAGDSPGAEPGPELRQQPTRAGGGGPGRRLSPRWRLGLDPGRSGRRRGSSGRRRPVRGRLGGRLHATAQPRPCARRERWMDGRKAGPAEAAGGAARKEERRCRAAELSFVPTEGPPPGGARLGLGRAAGTGMWGLPRAAARVASPGPAGFPPSRVQVRAEQRSSQRQAHVPAGLPGPAWRCRACPCRATPATATPWASAPRTGGGLAAAALMCRHFRSHLSASYMSQSYSKPLNFTLSQLRAQPSAPL